jgi:hypothetical protein
MKQQLPKLRSSLKIGTHALLMLLLAFAGKQIYAQTGTWTAVKNLAPAGNFGNFILLSDGSVLCKSSAGGFDGYGNTYNKLTPDSHGSYINGTWSSIAPMKNTRLYYSTQVLKDGRVYVCGGEYGTGGSAGEFYNPLTNTWTLTPAPGAFVSDANSEILDDGTVLQAIVQGNPFLRQNKFWTPATNTYSAAPSCIGFHNESAWLKLPDNSILMVDRGTRNSERYIPSLNAWVADATVPVDLYDPFGLECGGAVLLPNGKGLFLGSLGHNAIYTPSGNNNPGSWVAAPDFPNGQGTPDAAAAMMVNGKVLCITSPAATASNHFPTPTSYYEYDYIANSFTRINAPQGGLTTNVSSYVNSLIDLPNGQVLYGTFNDNQYYIYTPAGSQVNTQKPVISQVGHVSGNIYGITGTGFNGISEGATDGDDWQVNTNYPIVRLTNGTNVYYARTFNWNHTGVRTGALRDTVFVTPPPGLPRGSYQLVVVANGISSDPIIVPIAAGGSANEIIASATNDDAKSVATLIDQIKMYPNPAKDQTTIHFVLANASHVSIKVYDLRGKEIANLMNADLKQGDYSKSLNTSSLSSGIYTVKIVTNKGAENLKLVVQ